MPRPPAPSWMHVTTRSLSLRGDGTITGAFRPILEYDVTSSHKVLATNEFIPRLIDTLISETTLTLTYIRFRNVQGHWQALAERKNDWQCELDSSENIRVLSVHEQLAKRSYLYERDDNSLQLVCHSSLMPWPCIIQFWEKLYTKYVFLGTQG